ncbi:MAG TPA: metallophosphoesterase family protein [Desulfotignum sp.]|nr:metallophosphoesterase family protein [Desulfotignum sp.]
MKIAILSDVHGNLEALQTVLAKIHTLGLDEVVCLGDNIGYGPDPQAVMDLLAAHNIASVLGNHEMAVKNRASLEWFNPMAQKALEITRSQLSVPAVADICKLPFFLVKHSLRFVHGVPPANVFLYLFQVPEKKLIQKLDRLQERICFVGHTHDLGIISWDGASLTKDKLVSGVCQLDADKKYIINAGSVGQPRDGTYEAKFLVYDTRTLQLSVKALAYPFAETAKKIIAAGIPKMYAEKLAVGSGTAGRGD